MWEPRFIEGAEGGGETGFLFWSEVWREGRFSFETYV